MELKTEEELSHPMKRIQRSSFDVQKYELALQLLYLFLFLFSLGLYPLSSDSDLISHHYQMLTLYGGLCVHMLLNIFRAPFSSTMIEPERKGRIPTRPNVPGFGLPRGPPASVYVFGLPRYKVIESFLVTFGGAKVLCRVEAMSMFTGESSRVYSFSALIAVLKAEAAEENIRTTETFYRTNYGCQTFDECVLQRLVSVEASIEDEEEFCLRYGIYRPPDEEGQGTTGHASSSSLPSSVLPPARDEEEASGAMPSLRAPTSGTNSYIDLRSILAAPATIEAAAQPQSHRLQPRVATALDERKKTGTSIAHPTFTQTPGTFSASPKAPSFSRTVWAPPSAPEGSSSSTSAGGPSGLSIRGIALAGLKVGTSANGQRNDGPSVVYGPLSGTDADTENANADNHDKGKRSVVI